MSKKKYRSVFISDLHLGTRGSKAREIVEFLKTSKIDNLYLIGDVIDIWMTKRILSWPQDQVNVIRYILSLAKKDVNIFYIPGNHDSVMRKLHGMDFGNIHIRKQCMHIAADGRKYLIMHGDEFDDFIIKHESLCKILSHLYHGITVADEKINLLLRVFNKRINMCRFFKTKSKKIANKINNFEEKIARRALEKKCQGVICGHIHKPEIRVIDNITYINSGDWVENCTAISEDYDGNFEIISYKGL